MSVFLVVSSWGNESTATEATTLDDRDPIDQMMEILGTTRSDLVPDATTLLLRSRRSLNSPLTTRLLLHPLEAPYVVGVVTAEYRRWSFSPLRLSLQTISQTPAEISRGYFGNPLAQWDRRLQMSPDPLVGGLEAVWEATDTPAADDETQKAWRVESENLPDEWRLEIGRLLMAAASATQWQRKAFAPLDDDERKVLELPISKLIPSLIQGVTEEVDLRETLAIVDLEYLFAGYLDLVAASEDFLDFLDHDPPAMEKAFELSTPLGWVVIRAGDESTSYGMQPEGHHLLIVDLGGDDLYTHGVCDGGYRWPVQLIFDEEGNDGYIAESENAPSWGGAVFGYSLLFDRKGNDTYQGAFLTQGTGVLGAGLLFDQDGDDRYDALAFSQGTGYAGIGILQDRGGSDQYTALTRAQGCGQNLGAGSLFDEGGDDTYILHDEEPIIPSAQTREHNSSMGQGMGFGQRADLEDGHSVPGGVGMLYDLEGDDRYSAGVFAQGCGFLGGAGLLIDDAGSDTLKAVYYVQGSSAHRAAGVLINHGGNDVYEATLQCAQGCGHDLGVGWLYDDEGDDRYSVYRLGQGAANENGWGFLVDLRGNDRYEVKAPGDAADSLGAGKLYKWGTIREDVPALGFFLDAGGTDVYRGVGNARDNSHWLYPRRYPESDFQSERGIGWDGEFPTIDLPTGPRTAYPEGEFEVYREQQALRRRYREKRKD